MDLNLSRKQNHTRQWQIVGPINSTSAAICSSSPSFKLPSDWVVKLHRRRCDGRFDKYYYEPGTGRKFRSLLSIQRYLSEEINVTPKRRKPGNEKNMPIIPYIFKSCSSFGLPDGWVVEEKPRKKISYPGQVDRYYYEPGTGRKFRSLLSIQRYLNEEINVTPNRKKPVNEKNMPNVPRIFNSCSSFGLPDGWVVEEKTRNNKNYPGRVDRTYIEPGTGKRFHSLLSVERYIAEGKSYAATPKPDHLCLTDGREHTAIPKALKLGDRTPSNRFGCEKKHSSGNEVETSILDLCRPPADIKWVLSPVGNIWSPFIDNKLVPESLKHKWSQTFFWALNNGH